MKTLTTVFLLTVSFVPGLSIAQTTVTQYPGATTVVRAGENVAVYCEDTDGGNGQNTAICDCIYGGTQYGQSVGTKGHIEECKRMNSYASPRNCVVVTGPVICDCIYAGTRYGQSIGMDGHLEQCKSINSYARPRNCVGL